MPPKAFPIANFKTGLDKSLAPWLVPDDAYTSIYNAHIENGQLTKRKGSTAIWRFPTFCSAGSSSISGIAQGATTTIQSTNHPFVNGQIVQLILPDGPDDLTFTGRNYYLASNCTSSGFDVNTLQNEAVDSTNFAAYGGMGTTYGAVTIQNAVLGTTTTITTVNPHGLTEGQSISLFGIQGTTELNFVMFQATSVTPTTFVLQSDGLNVDSSQYVAYSGAGLLVTYPSVPIQGFLETLKNDGSEQLIVLSGQNAAVFDESAQLLQPLSFSALFNTEDIFQGANFNNRLFCIANSTPFLAYDPNRNYLTTFAPQYGPATTDLINTCALIHHLEGRLILFAPTFSGSLAGVYRNRIVASAQVSPDRQSVPFTTSGPYSGMDFRIDIPGNAFYLDLDTDDSIISVQDTKGSLVIYCTRSIWKLRATPSATRPYVAERIHSIRGCSSKNASVKFEESVASLGREGLVATDGQNIQRLDSKIPQWIYDQLDTASYTQIIAGRDERFRQIWFLYPDNDQYIALICQEDSLTFSLYNVNISILGNFIDPRPEATWATPTFSDEIDDANVTFADLDLLWDSFETQTLTPVLLGGNNSGEIFIMNRGSSDNGNAISMSVTSKEINPYIAEGTQSKLVQMDICCKYDPTAVIKVNVFSDSDQLPISQNIEFSTASGSNTMQRVWKRLFFGQIASFHKIELQETSVDGQVQIEAIIPYLQQTKGRLLS